MRAVSYRIWTWSLILILPRPATTWGTATGRPDCCGKSIPGWGARREWMPFAPTPTATFSTGPEQIQSYSDRVCWRAPILRTNGSLSTRWSRLPASMRPWGWGWGDQEALHRYARHGYHGICIFVNSFDQPISTRS